MFEGWVANLLNRVLGAYVEDGCFRPDKVSTSIYGGHMVLSELEVRKDAFDTVGVPIKLRRGFIGQVDVKIPWTHLGSQPVEISIDRVFLILEPSLEYNERDYQRKVKARKKADLARAELRKSSGMTNPAGDADDTDAISRAHMSEAEEMAKVGFTARLMNKIVDNIELNVRNVHVRYEDRVTNPKHAFSVGATWESLKMQSTDRHWTPCFVDLVSEIKRRLDESGKYLEKLLAYKLFRLDHFAIYWDPFPGTSTNGADLDYSTCTFAEMAAIFERMIPKRQQQEEEDYRLVERETRRARAQASPAGSGAAGGLAGAGSNHGSAEELTDGRGSASDRPLEDSERIRSAAAAAAAAASASHQKTRARLGTGAQHCFVLEPVSLTLKMQSNRDPRFPESPDTVVDLDIATVTLVLERFQYLDAWEMLAAFDAAEKSYPYAQFRPQGVTVRDAPRIWWQFAIRATLEDVQERRRRFSPEYITDRRQDRLLYIELWKRSLAGRPRSEVAASAGTPSRKGQRPQSSVAQAAVDSPLQLRRDMIRRGRRIAEIQGTPRSAAEKRLKERRADSAYESASQGQGNASPSSRGNEGNTGGTLLDEDEIAGDGDASTTIVVTDYLELNAHERSILEDLEDRYDVQDVMYFRSLAEHQLRLERAHLRLVELERRASGLPASGPTGAAEDTPSWAGAVFGWAGWAVGLGGSSGASHAQQQRPATSSSASAAAFHHDRPLMTREEQARLFEMLSFDPTEILVSDPNGNDPARGKHAGSKSRSAGQSGNGAAGKLGANGKGGAAGKTGGAGSKSTNGAGNGSGPRAARFKSVMRFRMEECRLQLWDNANPADALATPDLLVDVHFWGTSVRVSKRENGTDRALLSLENLEVFDWCSSDERFTRIVALKEMTAGPGLGLADTFSSGVSAFSDLDRASHVTPPAWSGAAERMEFNYRKRKAMERQMLQRSARQSEQRRRHSTSVSSAAWAATLAGFDIPGSASLMEGDDGLPVPEPLLPSFSDFEGSRRGGGPGAGLGTAGIGDIDETTSYPEGLSEDGSSAHRMLRARHVAADSNSELWGVRSSRGRGMRASRPRGTAVFSLEVDSHCPETGADMSLRLRLRPLELIYSPSCVDRVSAAFQIPDSVFTYREAQLASINDFSNVQSRNRAKVEYAYQNHFSVSMDVDMQAPLLILPQQVPAGTAEEDIKLVLVDFGRMTVRDKALSPVKREARSSRDASPSHLPTKRSSRDRTAAVGESGSKAAKVYGSPLIDPTNSPSSSLEPPRLRVRGTTGSLVESTLSTSEMSRFFDEYKISCSNVQVLATSMDTNWRSGAEQHRRHMHVIDRFTFNVILCVSILQYDRTLPQYKFSANLPSLHIHLTPEKYEAMAQVANSLQSATSTQESNYRGFDAGELVIGGGGDSGPQAQGNAQGFPSRAPGEASPRFASVSDITSPFHRSVSSPLAGLSGIEGLAPLDSRMPSLHLNSSAESVSSSVGGHANLRQDRFHRLPSVTSLAASSASTTAAGGPTPEELSPRRSKSFMGTTASSSGPSAPASPRGPAARRLDSSDWESASIAASLHETLRTADEDLVVPSLEDGGGGGGGVDDIDDFDNDFYTTVGSVAHTSFRRQQLSESESVSSFVSALQGDELGEGGLQPDSASADETPRARTNVSYLQCSMSIEFIMLSVSRPKIVPGAAANTTQATAKNAARARRRSFGLDSIDDNAPIRRGSNGLSGPSRYTSANSQSVSEREGATASTSDMSRELGSPRQKPVIKPHVRDWLDEINELERREGSPSLFHYSRKTKTPTKSLDATVKQSANAGSRSAVSDKMKRFSSSLIDEALEEVLAGESDDEEGTGDRTENENLGKSGAKTSDDEEDPSVAAGENDDAMAREVVYEEYEGIVLVLVENICFQASLRTMETSVDFSMRSVTVHDVVGQDLTEVRLSPGIADRLAEFPQLVKRATTQTPMRSRSNTRLLERRIDRPRLHSEVENEGSFFAVGLQALAKDSPLYGGVGADLRISGGAIDVTFSQSVLSALLDAFGSAAILSGSGDVGACSTSPNNVNAGPQDRPERQASSQPSLPIGSTGTDAIQAQVQATLKQLTVAFVGAHPKQRSVRQSRSSRREDTVNAAESRASARVSKPSRAGNGTHEVALAELKIHEVELRAATREDGQSSVSARLGNFALRDCLTGIGSALEQRRRTNLADATFTISEKELSLGNDEAPGVLIMGSRRRENDKRPLLLLQSTFYSEEWRKNRLIVGSPLPVEDDDDGLDTAGDGPALDLASSQREDQSAAAHTKSREDGPNESKAENVDEDLQKEPRSAGRDSVPHLDLDDVLDSYLRDSPPTSPHAGGPPTLDVAVPSARKKIPKDAAQAAVTRVDTCSQDSRQRLASTQGCGHRGCRNTQALQYEKAEDLSCKVPRDLEEASEVAVPALPAHADVQFQVRSFFCRANVDFLHAAIDYIYEGDLLRSLSQSMEYAVIREDQKLERTQRGGRRENDDDDDGGPNHDDNRGVASESVTGNSSQSEWPDRRVSARLQGNGRPSQSAKNQPKLERLVDLNSVQVLLFDCALEIPSTQQGSPMGIIHVGAADLHNQFFLGDSSAAEQADLLRDKPNGAHALHAVESISLRVSNLSMQVPEAAFAGNTTSFKIIQDTSIHAKVVRHIGTAWVCRAQHDPFCQEAFAQSELSQYWMWSLSPRKADAGPQAIKAKLSVSQFALRISELHVATMSGILDHLAGLDAQDITVKLRNMQAQVDPSGAADGGGLQGTGRNGGLPLSANENGDHSSQLSLCSCPTPDHDDDLEKKDDTVTTAREQGDIARRCSGEDPRSTRDTLIMDIDFELSNMTLALLWSSSSSRLGKDESRHGGLGGSGHVFPVAVPPFPNAGLAHMRRAGSRRTMSLRSNAEPLGRLEMGPFFASFAQTRQGSSFGNLEIGKLSLSDQRPKHLQDASDNMIDAGGFGAGSLTTSSEPPMPSAAKSSSLPRPGMMLVEEEVETAFVSATWSRKFQKPKRRPERASFVHQVTEETIKVDIANTELCLVQALVLAGAKWTNEAEEHARMQNLWPPRFPDLSVSTGDMAQDAGAAVPSESQSRAGGAGSTVTEKTTMPHLFERARSLVSRNSGGPGSVVSRPSQGRSGGASRTGEPAFRSPMPGGRLFPGLDSASLAPVFSWASDSGDDASERITSSPQGRRSRVRATLPMKSMLWETVTNVDVNVVGLEIHVMEHPKQKDSRALSAHLDFSLATKLSSSIEQRDLVMRSSFTIPRKTIVVTKRPEWVLDINACSLRLGTRRPSSGQLQRPGSAGSHASREATSRAQQLSVLVQPFQASVRYRVGPREGSNRPTHILDAGVGQIDSQVSYNEIRAVAEIAQRVAHFLTDLENTVQGESLGSVEAGHMNGHHKPHASSPSNDSPTAARNPGRASGLRASERADSPQNEATVEASRRGGALRAASNSARGDPDSTQDKSAAARAAVGELAEKTLGASVAGAHFRLDFTGARFLLVDDMHGQSSPVVELVARRSDSDIDIGPNGLLARTRIAIGADSYNHRLGAWEPLLEPWRVQVRALVPTAERGHLRGLRMSASVDSQSILNVNLTEAFVESVSGATQIWNPDKTHVGRNEFQRDSVSLFRIYNETGLPIAFWTRDGEVRPLQSGSEMPIQFDGLGIATGRRDHPEADGRKVSLIMRSPDASVQESPWQPLRDIPLDREGSFLFRLGATSKHPEVRAITVTCDVVAVGSAKVVCVRSNLLLRNHCVGPMEVVVPTINHGNSSRGAMPKETLFKYRLAPGEVIPVPVHVAELINAHVVKVSVRPSAYSDPYDFQSVGLPVDLSSDCSEASSMRTTLDFAAGGPGEDEHDHLMTYCAVDCRSGVDAVKALSSSTWDQDSRNGAGLGGKAGRRGTNHPGSGGPVAGNGAMGQNGNDMPGRGGPGNGPGTGQNGVGRGGDRFMNGLWSSSAYHGRVSSLSGGSSSGQHKTSFASTAAAAAAALNGNQNALRGRDYTRRHAKRKPWAKRRLGEHASPQQSGTSLRIISFEAPLLVSNLLASPITYRLRADGASHAAADGQLPVGNSLRWQGIRPEADLSLSVRLSGFDWSSVLQLEGVPFIRPRRGSVGPPTAVAAASSAAALLKSNSTSSMSVSSQSKASKVGDEKQTEEGVIAGTDGLGDGNLRWSALQDGARVGILRQESIQLKDSNRRTLTVSAELSVLPGGIRKLVLFVPYWIVNLSDLHLLVRSASRSASLAETFGGHIAAGQNDAMAVMRRLRMRQKLGERYLNRRGVTGERRAPGGLLDILDDTVLHGGKRTSDPLMFSYTDTRRKKGRICVKAADSGWSQAMGLDSAGTAGLIELKQQWNVKSDSPRQLFVLGVSIAVAEGQFRRTKVITLTPRFVLINALGRTLKVKQRPLGHGTSTSSGSEMFGLGGVVSRLFSAKSVDAQQRLYGSTSVLTSASERADSIRPGERTPYHWRDASAPREICVRFDEYGWIWSGGFSIDNIGEFYVRLRNEHTHAVYILRVDVALDRANTSGSSTIFITFRPELPSLPPYRIDNLSLQTLRLYQRGAPPQTQQVLLPYHSCPYTWDDLSLSRMLVVESLASSANSSVGGRNASSSSIRGKVSGLLHGIWNMLWDQTGAGASASEARPVTLGHIELDRLQLATSSTDLPHITIGVHADGPTRVLSIVDARNKGPSDTASPLQALDGSTAGAFDESWWSVFSSLQNSPERVAVDDVELEDLFRDDPASEDGVGANSGTSALPGLSFELASPTTGDLDTEPLRDREETSSMGFDMSYVGEASLQSPQDFFHANVGRPRQGTQETVDAFLHRSASEVVASDTIVEDEPFEESRFSLAPSRHKLLSSLHENSDADPAETHQGLAARHPPTPLKSHLKSAMSAPPLGEPQDTGAEILEGQEHALNQAVVEGGARGPTGESQQKMSRRTQARERRQQQQQQQQQQLLQQQGDESVLRTTQSQIQQLRPQPQQEISQRRRHQQAQRRKAAAVESGSANLLASWMELKLSLRGVGLSVVESVPRRELLYVTVLDIRSRVESVADLSRLQIRVGWIQADNQLYGAFYPVMFAPRSWNRTALRLDQLGAASVDDQTSRSRSPSTVPMVTQDSSADPANLYTSAARAQQTCSPALSEGSDADAIGNAITPAGGGRSGAGSDEDDERKPFAEFALVRSTKFPSLDFVRHVNVRILPMNLKLEPDVLTALLAFSSRCGTSLRSVSRWQGDGAEALSAAFVGSNSLSASNQDTGKAFPGAGGIVARDVVLSGGRQVAPLTSGLETHTYADDVRGPETSSRQRAGNSESMIETLPPPPVTATIANTPHGAGAGNAAVRVAAPPDAALRASNANRGVVGARRIPSSSSTSSLSSMSSASSLSPSPDGRGARNTHEVGGRDVGVVKIGSMENSSLPRERQAGTPVEVGSSVLRASSDSSEHGPVRGGALSDSLPASQRKLYIEELQVHPIKMHVSFSFRSNAMRIHGHQDPGLGFAGQYGASAAESGTMNPLRFALNAMGASLANVDNAPLRLNALVLQNSLSTPETILGRIFAHYRSQALRQAYLILGSVDLLGDPRGLVQNLGAGVLDFFYEPALGLVRSPKDFGAGLAKGTMSLLRRTVLGAATSATGFANGASALFETLSNDRYSGFKPRSFAEGVAQGLAGLVVAPVNGFQDEGFLGLGQGLFYGVTGVFVKPLAGLLKLVKHVSVAIQSTIDPTVKFRRHRIRPPRYFVRLAGDSTPALDTANKLLVPFDLHKAVGEEVIAMVDNGVYLDEGHLAHVVLEQPLLADDLGLKRDEVFGMKRDKVLTNGNMTADGPATVATSSRQGSGDDDGVEAEVSSSDAATTDEAAEDSSSPPSAGPSAESSAGPSAESSAVMGTGAGLALLDTRRTWHASLIDVRRTDSISGAVLSPAAVLVGQDEGAFETIGGGVAISDEDAEARAVDAACRASRLFSFFTFHAKRPFPGLPLWKRMFLVATHQHLLYVERSLELERSTWAIPLRSVKDVDLRRVELAIEDDEGDDGLTINRSTSGAESSPGVVLWYWLVEVSTPTDSVSVYCWTENQAKACVFFIRNII